MRSASEKVEDTLDTAASEARTEIVETGGGCCGCTCKVRKVHIIP